MPSQPELPTPGNNKNRGAMTEKGHRRQEMVLSAASKMFSRFGYDSVSINDIGAAAGISGPGIYRYFNSKEDILIAIFEYIHSLHRQSRQQILASGGTDEQLLRALISLQVELAVSEPEMIRIMSSEERHLPKETADTLRDERRGSLQAMSDLLHRNRPDLSQEKINVTIHAMLALINSISLRHDEDRLSDSALEHLENMALGMLELK